MAPGSGQRVKCKARFQAKARKAAARCQEAVDEEDEVRKAKLWRKVFGNQFPKVEIKKTEADLVDNEQFIEDRYPLDIVHSVSLDCEIREGTTLVDLLRQKLRRKERIPTGRHLRFYVTECDVPGDYTVLWKVRNRGEEAVRRKQLRGEITFDVYNRKERIEKTDFGGSHYVEVYVVKNGVCVARERIAVPI